MKIVKRKSIRLASVAGTFYPASPTELVTQLDEYFEQVSPVYIQRDIRALVIPHAGYMYSGKVAAAAFHSLSHRPKKVFILASNHSRVAPLFRISVGDYRFYETPIGQVRVSDVVQKLLEINLFEFVSEAHSTHVIEVMLPFLQRLYGDDEFEIIPIVTGQMCDEDVRLIASTLSNYIDEDSLIVVSSDLSHYHEYDEAVALDASCVDAILALDPMRLKANEACGLHALLILFEIARTRRWIGTKLQYSNSGDTDERRGQVVGYAALAFC